MKYNKVFKAAVALAIALSVMLSQTFIKSDENVWLVFSDVDQSDWYGESVYNMVAAGVIPGGSDKFYPLAPASRQDMILYLFNLAHINTPYDDGYGDVPFTDVDKNGKYYKAISWAYGSGITQGYDNGTFDPEGQCTREELCTLIMRYLTRFGIKPKAVGSADMFGDSLTISDFAKSYVLAARLAGFLDGDQDGNFRPRDCVTRAELAKILSKMLISSNIVVTNRDKFVDTTYGAYDWCYEDYKKLLKKQNHVAYVEYGNKVNLSYFDDAVFVGDSVSMSLQLYCAANKALGNATFLCAGSLSPFNAHWEISDKSKHPVYQGVKMTVEDAVAQTGKRKVYIMLGINSLSMGLDNCVIDMFDLIKKILAKSPNATIILQSVTPMTWTSPIKSVTLNNDIIRQYNARLLQLAQDNGWYYVNVSEAVKDNDGNLRSDFCSDPDTMGIHFTFDADRAWVDYLLTHAPQID